MCLCDFTWPLNVAGDVSPAASGGCSLCHMDCTEMRGARIQLSDVAGFSAVGCDVGVSYFIIVVFPFTVFSVICVCGGNGARIVCGLKVFDR